MTTRYRFAQRGPREPVGAGEARAITKVAA